MALPSSGPISLSMLRATFGGAVPDSLGEYYAGGVHVPAGTSGVNGLVPSSGALSLSRFYGASPAAPVQVRLTDQTFGDQSLGGAATYTLNASGAATRHTVSGGLASIPSEWLVTGVSSDYQARASVLSGHLAASSAVNTWLSLAATQAWSVEQAQGVATVLVEIRRVSDNLVLASATIHMTAGAL